jgi:hypothetical protein
MGSIPTFNGQGDLVGVLPSTRLRARNEALVQGFEYRMLANKLLLAAEPRRGKKKSKLSLQNTI